MFGLLSYLGSILSRTKKKTWSFFGPKKEVPFGSPPLFFWGFSAWKKQVRWRGPDLWLFQQSGQAVGHSDPGAWWHFFGDLFESRCRDFVTRKSFWGLKRQEKNRGFQMASSLQPVHHKGWVNFIPMVAIAEESLQNSGWGKSSRLVDLDVEKFTSHQIHCCSSHVLSRTKELGWFPEKITDAGNFLQVCYRFIPSLEKNLTKKRRTGCNLWTHLEQESHIFVEKLF